MLREALTRKPPTGFVRDFVVEESGDHHGELDLKRRGPGPGGAPAPWGAAGARWGAGGARIPVCPTPDRLRQARHAGLLTPDQTDTLLGAHDDLFRLVFRREIDTLRLGGPGRAVPSHNGPA